MRAAERPGFLGGLLTLAALLLADPSPAFPAEGTLQAPGQAEAVLADRVVAVVGRTPILASEAALEQAIRNRILMAADRSIFGRWLCEATTPLEALILAEVLRGQPAWDEAGPPDADLVSARVAAFRATFATADEAADFAERWGLSEDGLWRWFADSHRLDRTIEAAVDPLVRVDPKDEAEYYELHKDGILAGQAYADVAEFIGRQVYQRGFQRAWQAWSTQVRAAARVRYVGR